MLSGVSLGKSVRTLQQMSADASLAQLKASLTAKCYLLVRSHVKYATMRQETKGEELLLECKGVLKPPTDEAGSLKEILLNCAMLDERVCITVHRFMPPNQANRSMHPNMNAKTLCQKSQPY